MPDLRFMPAPGALRAGDRLAQRYVLLEQVGSGPTTLWQANDEVLARPVAVRLADASGRGGQQAVQPLLDAAARSGAASHPGLVRVYDAAVQVQPGGSVAYVIGEWVEGRRLDDLLSEDGPLDGPEASDLLRQAADALQAAHTRGLRHGRLHPGNLLVTADGRVRITDVEVAAALAPDGAAHNAAARDAGARDVTDDTRDLAAVAFALVTAAGRSRARNPRGRSPPSAAPAPAQSGPRSPASSTTSWPGRSLPTGRKPWPPLPRRGWPTSSSRPSSPPGRRDSPPRPPASRAGCGAPCRGRSR